MEKLYNIFFTEFKPNGEIKTKTLGPSDGMSFDDATEKLARLQSSAIEAGDTDYAEGLSIDEYVINEAELFLK